MKRIELLQGDCKQIMRYMPDKSMDLILTDPPYGIGADKGCAGYGVANGRKYSGDWDRSIPPKEVFDEILRIGKKY